MKKGEQGAKAEDKAGRRAYRRPELKHLGEVREMTAGGSRRSNEDNANPGNPDTNKRRP